MDKLIHTGRGRKDDNMIPKEDLFLLRTEIRVRYRSAHLEPKTPFSLCYPNPVSGQNNTNACYKIPTAHGCVNSTELDVGGVVVLIIS